MKRAVCGVVVIAIVLACAVRFEAAESKIAVSTSVVPEISFSLAILVVQIYSTRRQAALIPVFKAHSKCLPVCETAF